MRITTVIATALLCGAAATASAKPAPGDTEVQTYEFHSGRGALGIAVIGITDPLKAFFGSGKDGVLVGQVVAGSPADKAGIRVGDVVTKVEGKPIDDVSDVRTAMTGEKKGDHTKVEVVREHRALTLDATLDADVPSAVSFGERGFPPDAFGQLHQQDADLQKWMEHVEHELQDLRQQQQRPAGGPHTRT